MDVPIDPAFVCQRAIAEIDASLATIRNTSIQAGLSDIVQSIHRKIPALLVGDDVLQRTVLARAAILGLDLVPNSSASAFLSRWLANNLPDGDAAYWVRDLADRCRRDALSAGIQFAALEAELQMPLEQAIMNATKSRSDAKLNSNS